MPRGRGTWSSDRVPFYYTIIPWRWIMKEAQLTKLLDEKVDIYINNIAKELETSHARLFEDFGFPMFGVTSNDYHEQVYFQSYLESYTRKMINGMLKGMTDYEVSEEIDWPEFEYAGIYTGYTNIECEKEFGFEFINPERKIGYRYTRFYIDEIDGLLAKGNVNSIELIVWENKDYDIGIEYGDPRVKIILLWDLFQELFSELNSDEIRGMYDQFVEAVSKAVDKANSMISLETLPGFTGSYLYKTKDNTINSLRNEINNLSYYYVKNQKFKSTQENSKALIDTYHIPDYFLENHRDQAFIGKSAYSKCYLTSEYLFHYFSRNPLFDYTPIVSGYIKSIEQLLNTICLSYRNSVHEYLNMGSYTMGDYIQYLDSHEEIFRMQIRTAKSTIIDCLNSYRAESRNHLFHRDYFNDWERVETIRRNTIFLYAVLLGGIDDSLIRGNSRVLDLIDRSYDNLYNSIMNSKSNHFCVELQGKEYTNLEIDSLYSGLQFNQYGQIQNHIILRRLVYDQYEKLELSPENMPSAVWTIDPFNGKKQNKIFSI